MNGEELEKWGADIIFGRAQGLGPWLMRRLLWGFSWLFRAGVALRLKSFQAGWKKKSYLGTMVVSIGNLTVGGTGKTPVVELLARSLSERGRRVAILSRGYKSRPLEKPQPWEWRKGSKNLPMPKVVSAQGEILLDVQYAGDEPYMLAKNLPHASVVVDKDRVNGGTFAISELEANVLLLDDGMQYLKLDHQIDIVLVDSGAPFGTNYLLPRGTLREPPKSLLRASYIFITKCSHAGQTDLIKRIRKYNKEAGIIECQHSPKYLENIFTGERMALTDLKGRYVAAISGIAVPESFEGLLKTLGADVEFHRAFTDHHTFTKKEIQRFMDRCLSRDIEFVITTEKDAVRFHRPDKIEVPVYFLRIEVEIISGYEVWDECLSMITRDRSRPLIDRHVDELIAGKHR